MGDDGCRCVSTGTRIGEFSHDKVVAGQTITLNVRIRDADAMIYASIFGPGRTNHGRVTEWERDGGGFTASIAIGPLQSGKYRISSLGFVGVDGGHLLGVELCD